MNVSLNGQIAFGRYSTAIPLSSADNTDSPFFLPFCCSWKCIYNRLNYWISPPCEIQHKPVQRYHSKGANCISLRRDNSINDKTATKCDSQQNRRDQQSGRQTDRQTNTNEKKLVDILPPCTPSSRTEWMCRYLSCSWDALNEMMFCFKEKVLIFSHFIHIPSFRNLFQSIFLILERGLRVIPIVHVLLMICRGWLV